MTSRRTVALVLVVTTAAATLERLWFPAAWNEAGSITSAFYYGDATRYVDFALAILSGRTFDNGIPYHPPGWPLVMAAFFRLLGVGSGAGAAVPVGALKAFIACLSGLTVGLTTLLAYEMAGLGAMLGVAFLGTFNFGHIVEGTVANSEALYGLLVVAALFAVWRWVRSTTEVGRFGRAEGRSIAWAGLAGAIAGFAMLVRPEFLACAVVLFAAAAWRRGGARWPELALFVVLFGLVLVPTTIAHWRSLATFNASHVGRVAGPLPEFAPVTSYGAFNFAMANHEEADGGPNRDHPMLDQCNTQAEAELQAGALDLACPAVYDLYVHGYRIGLAWLADNPGAALALMGRKLEFAWGFLSQGFFVDDVGAGVDGTRRRVDLVDPSEQWLLPLSAALLLGGLVLLRREPVTLVILLAPIVAWLASTLLFFGYVRLGVSYLPAVWILQATALAAIGRFMGSGRGASRKTARWAIAILVALTAVDGLRVRTPRQVVVDGPRNPAGVIMQDETVEIRGAY